MDYNFTAYTNEDEMIPKNSSVIVARIPVTNAAPRNGPKTLLVPSIIKMFKLKICVYFLMKIVWGYHLQ